MAFGVSVSGIAYRVYLANLTRGELARIYPRLEQLIAIYSFTNWRSAGQVTPNVTLDSEWRGRDFRLDCKRINWIADGGDQGDGALLDCFRETVLQPDIVEPGEVEAPLISENEDFSYEFQWQSLFGYELKITVNPERDRYPVLYKLRDKLRESEACERELEGNSNARMFCSFSTYVIEISGLTSSQRIAFVAASGHPVWLASGTVDRRDEWTITLGSEDTDTMTLGELNKAIQLTARSMGFEETDLSRVTPRLETIWMKKDRVFITTLFSEIDKIPELSSVSHFLKNPS